METTSEDAVVLILQEFQAGDGVTGGQGAGIAMADADVFSGKIPKQIVS